MNNQSKKKALIAIKKAKTSLEKLIKQIEDDKYCIDIIQQTLAVIWLLKSTNINLLEWHLNCCVKSSIISEDKKDIEEKFSEIIKIIKISQK